MQANNKPKSASSKKVAKQAVEKKDTK